MSRAALAVPSTAPWGLTLLRVAVGVVFVAHGWQKLFVYTLPGVTASFAGMGLPYPQVSAYLATFAELIGGALLVLGLFTRLAAVPLAVTMAVAWATAHRTAFFLSDKGAEYVIVLLAAALALALGGGGALSADGLLFRRRAAKA